MDTPDRLDAQPLHPVLACADAIEAALKSVAGVEPAFMATAGKAEALVRLSRLADQVEALRLRVLAVSADVAQEAGARSTGDWLAHQTRDDRGPVVRAQQLADALDDRYGVVAAALGDGRMSLTQARVIVRALEDLPATVGPALRQEAEARLVADANELPPKALERLGRRILEILAPEVHDDHERRLVEAEEARAAALTSLRMRRRGDGCTDLIGCVPDAAAARLRTYLEAFTAPRQASTGNGLELSDPATGLRLPAHRLAGAAFCALLERLDPTTLPVHGGTATTVVVTMTLDQLREATGVATLPGGTTISPGEVRRLACTSGILPAVLGGASEVLDLGRSRRLFSPAQHKALALRHSTCRAEGCTIPARWCEAHHAGQAWASGGRTDLADGLLLCSWHHHRTHDPAYRTERLPSGELRYHRRT